MNRDLHISEVKNATSLRFNTLWKQNYQTNHSAILKNPGILVLRKRFDGVPGIVVGAGPSLEKNIALLNRVSGKAVIIASDAAMKPLLQHGIIPSFVISLDPQDDILKFFTGENTQRMILVAPSVVHPRILDLWAGRVLFYHQHAPDISVLTQIQNLSPKIGVLTPGGTVLSVACDLAFQMGCNPILFLGQDLAWAGKTTHSRLGSAGDVPFESTLIRQQENIVYEEDIFGKKLATLKSMSVSKEWFHWAFANWDRGTPITYLNCSESGIMKKGCVVLPFREAIYKYCRKKVNVEWTLKKALK
ncbi:MAG: hypothetical protein COV66_10150 [Nitrospinae bacterium CG11_big_fil_rev_8_21_14_0_20_45_15]|nr:MAG: hypothetical protein COV66_10150 [Nitrospinae bacterium CG11_big_fil_rev_8_21_14_0_20_45_15]